MEECKSGGGSSKFFTHQFIQFNPLRTVICFLDRIPLICFCGGACRFLFDGRWLHLAIKLNARSFLSFNVSSLLSSLDDSPSSSSPSVPPSTENQSAAATTTNHSLPSHSVKHKDRFNFASHDCGAIVLAANEGALSVSSILTENKDQYMLNRCTTPRHFVVIQLCDEILVDTFGVANYEYFSSTFETILVSLSDRYPPSPSWTLIGSFHANNSRLIQVRRVDF